TTGNPYSLLQHAMFTFGRSRCVANSSRRIERLTRTKANQRPLRWEQWVAARRRVEKCRKQRQQWAGTPRVARGLTGVNSMSEDAADGVAVLGCSMARVSDAADPLKTFN